MVLSKDFETRQWEQLTDAVPYTRVNHLKTEADLNITQTRCWTSQKTHGLHVYTLRHHSNSEHQLKPTDGLPAEQQTQWQAGRQVHQ